MKKSITLGKLKKSGWLSRTVKQELRENAIHLIQEGEKLFPTVLGYEETVTPQVENAVLAGHDLIFLGERGQAKTRMMRGLNELLDEWMPTIAGSEINDDPMNPISKKAKELISEKGDKTPISWLHQSDRFYEKLATPDVTVADLIGDIDPIKASNLKLSYSDERVIHFGMIPRAHRCIFVLNELPDLQARIQVALFSILQEKEIQIRGFKLRFPVEPLLIFTANPEDYTNRGSIVTPLKDRIGSQILTHYPHNREISKQITKQEAKIAEEQSPNIHIPELARDVLEQISFEARKSDYVDSKSGVSARMSITAFENLLSTAKRRMLMNGDDQTSLRMADFLGVISAINGKIEFVYEGEQEGAEQISCYLITQAVKTLFPLYFPEIKKLEKEEEIGPYDKLLGWFFKDNELFLGDTLNDKKYHSLLNELPDVDKILKTYQPNIKSEDKYFLIEFLLWGQDLNGTDAGAGSRPATDFNISNCSNGNLSLIHI